MRVLKQFDSPAEARRWISGRLIREWPPVYDVRDWENIQPIRAHYGEALFAGEIVAYALGLRTGYGLDNWHDSRIVGLDWYFDAREPQNAREFEECVQKLVRRFFEALREWEEAGKNPAPPGEGGACHYKPVAIAVSNFGGGIIGDRRTVRVRRFRV